MISTVAVLIPEWVAMFEFGVACEVFGLDRTDAGVPAIDFRVCSKNPGVPVPSSSPGVTVTAEHGLDKIVGADVIVIPAGPVSKLPDPVLVDAVRTAHENGSTIVTICSGAFLAAAAGLLDDRRCTTHWRYAARLAADYPLAKVDPDVLFVDEGSVITSAGTAAGIDACLHLVRREMGTTVANIIARRMVVPPQRDGGQRQFIEQPIVEVATDSFGQVLDWVAANLDQQHSVDDLAARVAMSPRTFARKFVAETGTTPGKWITNQRVLLAKQLLEESDLGLESIAQRCGFGSAALLRHHFNKTVGLAPGDYRRRFAVG